MGRGSQDSVLPITTRTVTPDEVLLAVADEAAASGGDRRIAPQASRIVLEELFKAVREHPE